jgi:hypothetical protein
MKSEAKFSNAPSGSKGAANPRISLWLVFRGGFLVLFFLMEKERSAVTLPLLIE